jgi:hypothetical protein
MSVNVGMTKATFRGTGKEGRVPNKGWIAHTTCLLGLSIPYLVRVFSNNEFSKAHDWISVS